MQRIAQALGRDVDSVTAEIADLRAKVRAAGATTPEAVADVLSDVTGIPATAILDEAERIVREGAP
jgi:class 3 adenylate cyclase